MDSKQISTFQLFTLLWITGIAEIIFCECKEKQLSLFDVVISSVAVSLIVCLIEIPILSVQEIFSRKNCEFNTNYAFAKTIFCVFMIIFFLISVSFTLFEFLTFLKNTFSFQISANLIIILTLIATFFISNMGIEGLARATVIASFLIFISMIVLTISLLPIVEKINFEPLFYDGKYSFVRGFFEIFSRTSFILVQIALMPYLNKKLNRSLIFWNTAVYGIFSVVLFLLCGVCGEFLKYQAFPLKTLVSIAKIGDFEHMDIIYICLFYVGVLVKTSLLVFLISKYAEIVTKKIKFLSKFNFKYTKMFTILLINIVVIGITKCIENKKIFFLPLTKSSILISMLGLTLILGFLIPLFLKLKITFSKKRSTDLEHN